jgi:hypothetical protein
MDTLIQALTDPDIIRTIISTVIWTVREFWSKTSAKPAILCCTPSSDQVFVHYSDMKSKDTSLQHRMISRSPSAGPLSLTLKI